METTVMPLFECSAVIYQGRPVVVLAAPLAATDAGRLTRLKVRTMRELAQQLGFDRIDSSLNAREPAWPALVAGGPNGVILEIDGRSPQVAEVAVPSRQWLDAANSNGSVHVAFVVPPRFRKRSLRRALARGRAFGGQVRMISQGAELWAERYTFLTRLAAGRPQPQRSTAILDACVVIDLERALSGRSSAQAVAQAQSLVMQLIHTDVLPGGAIAELITDRSGGTYDKDRARRLAAAVNAWFDGGAARVSSIGDVREAYEDELENPRSGPELPSFYEPDPWQHLHYACLLKLASLWSRARGGYRAGQRVELYAEYVSWMTHELGIVSVYPLQVARDRLIGSQGQAANYTDQLLKFGKQPLRNLWGASWDLNHIAMLDMIQDGDLIDIAGREVMLVTADRALVGLRQRIHDLAVRTATPRGLLPFKAARSDLDPRLNRHVSRIEAIQEGMNDAVWNRVLAGSEMPSIDHVLTEIARLERLVGRAA